MFESIGNSIDKFPTFILYFIMAGVAVKYGIALLKAITDGVDTLVKAQNLGRKLLAVADNLIYMSRRKKYDKGLAEKEFLDWQLEAMKCVYGPLIKERENEGIRLTALPFEKSDQNGFQEYESITIPFRTPVPYPFTGLCDKGGLQTAEDIHSNEANKNLQMSKDPKIKRVQDKYYRLVRGAIRHPNRMGYMLRDLDIKTPRITAFTGTYKNNLITSHILEYELYNVYRKRSKLKLGIDEIRENRDNVREKLLERMPIRKYIHDQFRSEGKDTCAEARILTSGDYRTSELGVQMIVAVKNYSGSYDVLRIRRSNDVAAKPGFLQFIPSGGFEAINDNVDFDSQWDNYSLKKAIYRELLEECFGIDEDDAKYSANNVSADRIYHTTYIKQLTAMLEGGAVSAEKTDGKMSEKEISIENGFQATMQIMGTTMSLVGLRHEICFLLKVEEPSFAGALISNYESKSAIHLVDINNIKKYDFWVRRKKDKSNEIEANDLDKLNSTSAALLELAWDLL